MLFRLTSTISRPRLEIEVAADILANIAEGRLDQKQRLIEAGGVNFFVELIPYKPRLVSFLLFINILLKWNK
jgi:hypothetical protein